MRSEGYCTWFVCQCVCVWTTILTLQATIRLSNDTNGLSATRARKKCWDFAKTTAFKRCGLKTSEKANILISVGLP